MSNSLRLIDTTLHDLTAPQVLEQMIHYFKVDRNQPVVLYTMRGQSKAFIARIRTELTRVRKQEGGKSAEFGFVQTSQVFVKENGLLLDAVTLEWRMTKLQLFRMMAHKMPTDVFAGA